jgi:hypothetical protein
MAATAMAPGSSGDPAELADGILGVALDATTVDGVAHTVVQVMLDDDRDDFDRGLLDAPMVAEVVTPVGDVVARELLDHDAFRRALHDERERGESVRRGVLLLDAGALPEPWIRLAFLPVPIDRTVGTTLQLRRATVDELLDGVARAVLDGRMSDAEGVAARTTIEHLHTPDD